MLTISLSKEIRKQVMDDCRQQQQPSTYVRINTRKIALHATHRPTANGIFSTHTKTHIYSHIHNILFFFLLLVSVLVATATTEG